MNIWERLNCTTFLKAVFSAKGYRTLSQYLYIIKKTKLRDFFFTLTTTQIQSTTMYASAYIQVSNLKIKPSKTNDAKKKKKKKKNGGHGGRSRVQCYQCHPYRNEIYTHYTAGEERCSIQTFPTTWQHTESGWIFLSTCLKERKF